MTAMDTKDRQMDGINHEPCRLKEATKTWVGNKNKMLIKELINIDEKLRPWRTPMIPTYLLLVNQRSYSWKDANHKSSLDRTKLYNKKVSLCAYKMGTKTVNFSISSFLAVEKKLISGALTQPLKTI